MARYSSTFSTPALGGTTEFATNTNILNLVGATPVLKLRRMTVSTLRVDAGTPVSLQIELGLYAATARGTATTTTASRPLLIGGTASTSPGIDTAWSVAPTIAASPILQIAFNQTATYEYIDESATPITIPAGAANGLVLRNLRAPILYQHSLAVTLFFDE